MTYYLSALKRVVVCGCGSILLAGCTSNAPTKFYLLREPQVTESAIKSEKQSPRVGVWRVRLPEYLNRSAMVSRFPSNELWISTTERWAEPLADNVTRVVMSGLSSSCGSAGFVALPLYQNESLDYELQLNFSAFERQDNQVVTEVRELLRKKGEKEFIVDRTQRVVEECDGSSANDTVSCMDRALQKVVADLSQAVAKEFGCR